ncbi:MAG: CSLREA domain-containing protein [Pirellulaceae bacterium]
MYVDSSNTSSAGRYFVDDGFTQRQTHISSDTANWPIDVGGDAFVQSTADGDAGNYIVFRGLTGTQLEIFATPDNFRAPINGIQIVGYAPRLTVDTLGDTDDGDPTNGMTLREAVNLANAIPGHQVITFDLGDEPAKILYATAGEFDSGLVLTDDMTIQGPVPIC